ncbi:MAG: hypothetical protein J0H43_15410 [Actinobacteria bacterium]|nr:hypothetical protein [Actinomycetota bacterium]
MPDLADLRDAFAHLEQEIPDNYRSLVVRERLAALTADPLAHRRARRRTVAAVVLAAAVVAAVAVGLTTLLGGKQDGRAGVKVGTSPSAPVSSAVPSSASSARSSARSSTPSSGVSGLPADAAALVTFVQGGKVVAASSYERGAYATGQPMQSTPGVAEFTTPSGNIACGITGTGSSEVACQVRQHSYPDPPKPASCTLNWASGWLSLGADGVTRGLCLGGPPFASVSNVLPYGSTIGVATMSCRVETEYLACADLTTGHGFAVSRSEYQTY